jgi:fucose permease
LQLFFSLSKTIVLISFLFVTKDREIMSDALNEESLADILADVKEIYMFFGRFLLLIRVLLLSIGRCIDVG